MTLIFPTIHDVLHNSKQLPLRIDIFVVNVGTH